MPEDLMPTGSFTSTLAVGNANVSDEISRAGASFGEIVLKTGEAVAETMKRLNETGANSATELANTVVDMIAFQEKIYDDLGNHQHRCQVHRPKIRRGQCEGMTARPG